MRILHVTTFLQGGAGRILTRLAIAQRRAGHRVAVVADSGGELGYGTYPEFVHALQHEGIGLQLVSSLFKRDPALNRAAADHLNQVADDLAPHIVHAHAATPARIARASGVCAAGGAGLLHTMHGWGVSKTAQQAADDLAAIEAADGVAVPSYAARAQLYALGLRRRDVRVIPYGLTGGSVGAPDPADARRLQGHQQRFVGLCIGTINERKNQRLFVDAMACPGLEDAVAVFIGDGDAAGLTAYARERQVDDRVLVLGPRADACRYLTLATALVLPSKNEGLPLAVLEALRAGVAVVATRLPEIEEAVGADSAHLLVDPGDADALARALRAAFDSADDTRAADARRARFGASFTEARMLAAYDELYHELAGATAPAQRAS
jgi:L-malate glycosyltransferase